MFQGLPPPPEPPRPRLPSGHIAPYPHTRPVASSPPGHGRHRSIDTVSRFYGPAPNGNAFPPYGYFQDRPPVPRPIGSIQASSSYPRPVMQPPRPRLNENDICPVCRRALPPKGANGDEAARETHIMSCISSHDRSSAGSRARASSSADQNTTSHPNVPLSTSPPARLHFISFVATEKDCLGEDGNQTECSICMVEYDVGDYLARLECLCKFHRECIVSWLARKQECPLHKIA